MRKNAKWIDLHPGYSVLNFHELSANYEYSIDTVKSDNFVGSNKIRLVLLECSKKKKENQIVFAILHTIFPFVYIILEPSVTRRGEN